MKFCDPEWLLADILTECSDVPETLARITLNRTARKFSTTESIKTWLDVPTHENVQSYPLEDLVPEGLAIADICDVKYNNCCVRRLSEACDDPMCGFVQDDVNHITLKGYCPGECDKLEVRVVLTVTRDACELPCEWVERFDDTLLNGTLARLYRMRDKSWTDYRLSEYYENQFLADVATAKCRVLKDSKGDPSRVRPERVL